MCRHRSIFPGSFPPSIFDADELNFRVRDGNGWTLIAIDTNSCTVKLYSAVHCGAPTGTRTRDTLIKSQVLYQLSYWCLTTHAKSTWKTERRVDDEKEHD